MRFLAALGMTNLRYSLFVIPNEVKNLDGYAIIRRSRFLAALGMTNERGSLFVIPNEVKNLQNY